MTTPLYAFLHLGKTGGHTFSRMVEKVVDPDEVLYLRSPYAGTRIPSRAPRWAMGHDCHWTHPRIRAIEDTGRPIVWLTILRDPVERVLSHYWAKVQQQRALGREFMDLGAFLRTPAGSNLMYAQMCRGTEGVVGEIANALDRLAVIGSFHCMRQFYRDVERVIGHALPRIEPQNVGTTHPPYDSVSEDVRGQVSVAQRKDILLCDAAVMRGLGVQRPFPARPYPHPPAPADPAASPAP